MSCWKGLVSCPRLTSVTVMILPSWTQVPLVIMAKKMAAAKRRRQNTPSMIRSRAWERTWIRLSKCPNVQMSSSQRLLQVRKSTFHCSRSPLTLCPSFALPCTRVSSPPSPSTTCSAICSGRKAIWARILCWENTLYHVLFNIDNLLSEETGDSWRENGLCKFDSRKKKSKILEL